MAGSLDDTIVGLATPPGVGAVAVLRVSGRDARAIAGRLVCPWPAPREVALRKVRTPAGSELDQALVLWMPGPRSFTGEDVVELHTHGGLVTPRRVQEALVAAGARPAEPGEFTRRAFLAGRLGLDQAEAIHDLVSAEDDAFADEALRQMHGSLRRRVEELRGTLVALAARVEAVLDFPEEDVPDLAEGEVAGMLGELRAALREMVASYRRGRILREGPSVVLFGRPNVGKSSLMNALLGTDRALVTPEAGTTRDVLEEGLEHRGRRLRLVDTAGLRGTESEAERLGIERAGRAAEEADVRVLVSEAYLPLEEEEIGWLGSGVPARTVLVRNKRDRGSVPPGGVPGGIPVVETVATEGEGLEALLDHIHGVATREVGPAKRGVTLTNVRHRDALRRAGEALERFQGALAEGLPPDVSLVELYEARDSLAAVIGAVGTEDVLDVVFSRFCIGK